MNKITLSEPPNNTAPKAGQFYQLVDEDSIYSGNVFFLVESDEGHYSLIDLSDGERWEDPTENIEQAFRRDREQFHLITSPFTITPNYN